MKKHCKVITTSFVGREIRERTVIAGDPPGFFHHSQNFPSPESVRELLARIYELEKIVDPGIESDTVIVNNDVGWQAGNDFLASLDNAPVFAGRLRIVNRENYGRSFGGYNRAFELFRTEYEYWTFTEDDILVIGDRYAARCIEAFNERAAIGFVAIQGLSTEIALHAHGGVGTTRFNVLNAVRAAFGALPHCGPGQPQDYDSIIEQGEVAFTNKIKQLGYDLVAVGAQPPLYAYAYDHFRGIRNHDWRHRSRLAVFRLRAVLERATKALVG